MNFFEQLDAEVSQAADEIGLDILIALLDKWEEDFERDKQLGIENHDRMLGHYVRLKIALHHVKRHYERFCSWTACDPRVPELEKRMHDLTTKTKEARINYYVAKRRIEEEHRTGCDCRGCRCLGYFSPGGSPEAGEPAPGA